MCSAVRRRMLENGTTWSPAVRNGAMETGGADAGRRAGAVGAVAPGPGRPALRGRPARPGRVAPGAGGGGGAADRRGVDHPQHVVAGDAAAGARAGDLGLVDVVLGQDPAHHGRQTAVPRRRRPTRRRPGGAAARGGRRRCGGGAGRSGRGEVAPRGGAAGGAGGGVSGAGLAAGSAASGAASPARGRRRTVADDGELHAHLDRLALGDEDLGEDAGRGRGHLGVDLVGRHLEERLVALDRVAHGLHPAGDRAFGHRLAELRHHDVSQGGVPFRSAPAWSRRTSRRATGAAG